MRIFTALLICFLLASCVPTHHTQFAELSSTSIPIQNNKFVFENDTLLITYNFWANRGITDFDVYNKLDIPIYIDWKKSSLILRDAKLDYWIDQSTINAETYYGTYLYQEQKYNKNKGIMQAAGVEAGKSVSQSVAVKAERVTFIPPKSHIKNSRSFQLMPSQRFDMSKATPKSEGLSESNIEYKDAKFKIRNFLTYSTQENMANEKYVNNEFYISKVAELIVKEAFEEVSSPEYSESIAKSKYFQKAKPYNKPSAFYIQIQ